MDRCRALANTVMNFQDPQNAAEFLSNFTIDSFLRRAQLHRISSCKQEKNYFEANG
jgi:hypothetical protein